MLTKEAFNALLKTLEEPPPFVKFILATTDPLKLPPTILSRTQHFRFKKISTVNIVNHLAHIMHLENIEYQNEALEILARSGSGSLRDTLTLLDQAIIFSKHFVDVQTVTDMLGLIDPEFINSIFTSIFSKNQTEIIQHVKNLEDYEAEMVVDELIAYLKERLYLQDTNFSTLILERFFRILSDAKLLFGINADGSFVLSLVFFKMVEALRIKEVDQMIEELESQIKRPEIKIDSAPKAIEVKEEPPVTVEMPSKPVHVEPQVTPVEKLKPIEPEPTPVVSVDAGQQHFEKLLTALNDRNAELGECFSQNIVYKSFEDKRLTWESCAEGDCKEKLRHGWGVINHFVKDIFGFETKIKNLKCTRAVEEKKTLDQTQESISHHPTPQEMDAQPIEEPASMIEDEVMKKDDIQDSSCVSGCGNEDLSQQDEASKEIDGASIMDEPMIRKAQEMFEATKITIQSKV
jgi:DNA polymerase-3 subunit gamma/tau